MLDNGIYRLYRYEMDSPSGIYLRLAARFAIHGKEIVVLEDHIHTLSDIIGREVTKETPKTLTRLVANGYYKLESEDDLNAGSLLEGLQEIDEKDVAPASSFVIEVEGSNPLTVELFENDVMLVDGQRLTPEQAQQLMAQIERGAIKVRNQ